jgi:hypothetical protein
MLQFAAGGEGQKKEKEFFGGTSHPSRDAAPSLVPSMKYTCPKSDSSSLFLYEGHRWWLIITISLNTRIFYMNIARPFRIIATIAAVIAAAFGMGTYTHANFTNIHMLFGLVVALALLIMAVIAVFTSGLRILGVIGIIYALILPIFGVQQALILVGDLHWLIETAHLALGFGAVALIGVIGERFARGKRSVNEVSTTSKAG